ncbi:hypothetical protein [Ilumatobacter sp.]|uniref:hypothetical protein n=1 Tax=Ilumatobacter sp. TaxID=1967498 RepID=UPI003B52D728
MSRIKFVGVALLVAMVGVWVVRSFVLDDSDSTAPTQPPPASSTPGDESSTLEQQSEPIAVVAASDLAGVPVGYPRSERGAATAAVNWVASFPTVVRMGPLRLDDMMSQLLSAERAASGSDEVVSDYFALFDELGPDFAERVWMESPLQVVTTQSTESAAQVSVWAMLVTGDPVDGPIEVLWRTHHVSLVWERDDWRIDDVAITEGPTPAPTDTALPSAPSEFVEVDGWEPAVFADTTAGGE